MSIFFYQLNQRLNLRLVGQNGNHKDVLPLAVKEPKHSRGSVRLLMGVRGMTLNTSHANVSQNVVSNTPLACLTRSRTTALQSKNSIHLHRGMPAL